MANDGISDVAEEWLGPAPPSPAQSAFARFVEAGRSEIAAAILTLADTLSGIPRPSVKAEAAEPVPGECLSVRQVADYLSVSAGTVRNLVFCGKLAASRIGKGRGTLRFNPADLEAFLRSSAGHGASAIRNRARRFVR